jgi:hypothetical protein
MSSQVTAKKTVSVAEKLVLFGLWSLIGLFSLLMLLTFRADISYSEVVSNIGQLLVGNLESVVNGSDETLLSALLTIIAVVLITLPLSIVAGAIFGRGVKSYNTEALEKLLDKGPWAVFLGVVIEELLTRGLFLGVFTKFFSGPVGFYAMFILGNTLWALVHVFNFTDKKERSPLLVIPQVIGGIAYTYLFVRYGLWASILGHFLFNAIIFATKKEKYPNAANLISVAYYLIVAGVLLIVFNARQIGLADLLPWLTGNLERIDGFTFWDYAFVLLMVDAIILIVANVLLLDRSDTNAYANLAELPGLAFVFIVIFSALLSAAIVLGVNWALSWFIDDLVLRTILITVLLSLYTKTSSGSALARVTIVNLPSVFLTIAAFTVLGFWPACGLAIVFLVVHFLPGYLES